MSILNKLGIIFTSIDARRWASRTKSRRHSDIASAASGGTRLLIGALVALLLVLFDASCLETLGGIVGEVLLIVSLWIFYCRAVLFGTDGEKRNDPDTTILEKCRGFQILNCRAKNETRNSTIIFTQ